MTISITQEQFVELVDWVRSADREKRILGVLRGRILEMASKDLGFRVPDNSLRRACKCAKVELQPYRRPCSGKQADRIQQLARVICQMQKDTVEFLEKYVDDKAGDLLRTESFRLMSKIRCGQGITDLLDEQG